MAEEKLLTIRDVSLLLGVSEKEVITLAENQTIPAYRLGGVYLRFKRQQIEEFKKKMSSSGQKINQPSGASLRERVLDFFYFNDFYIFSIITVLLILYIIFRGY